MFVAHAVAYGYSVAFRRSIALQTPLKWSAQARNSAMGSIDSRPDAENQELSKGIRVNVACPGAIRISLVERAMEG